MPLSMGIWQEFAWSCAVIGPTASGKSALGIDISRYCGGEVIAIDSRTMYRDVTIGTAKPTPDALTTPLACGCAWRSQGVVHHMIDVFDPTHMITAVDFALRAERCAQDMYTRNKLPVLVGGSGWYMDMVLDKHSIATVPPQPRLRQQFAAQSLSKLVACLREKDPRTVERIDINNRRRVERALEIVEVTGLPVPQRVQVVVPSTMVRVGLWPPTVELHRRIEERVDEQLANGLESEVVELVARYGWDAPGLCTIGYREWRPYFEGLLTKHEIRALLIRSTKQYAKRQITWFKRDTDLAKLWPAHEAMSFVRQRMNKLAG